jgi:molecular chaperone GrpE
MTDDGQQRGRRTRADEGPGRDGGPNPAATLRPRAAPTADAGPAADTGPTPDELLGLLRQERADFQNYRRRIADERATDLERARGQALEPIFPILDDLARAFANVPPDLESHPWPHGISLLNSRLADALQRLGLEIVGTPGEPFDPTRHEAIVYEPDPEARGQTVSAVIRPGYRLGTRLLRPAEVVVRGPVGSTPSAHEQDASHSSPPSGHGGQPEEVASGRPAQDHRAGG